MRLKRVYNLQGLEVGSQIRIKRKLFEQYLDGVGTI